MRILHVVPSYLPAVRYGGPIFAVHGLCKALVREGHQVEVFTTNVDGPGNSPVPLGVPVNRDGVLVRYFPCPMARRLYWAPALNRALCEEVGQFDIVHLHSVFLWPTWAAARAAKNANIPYVLSPRGMLVKDLIARRSRIAKSAWIRLIEKSNIERAAAVHLTSQTEALELMHFGWRIARTAVIPNGLESSNPTAGEVSADVKEVARSQPIILFLGRISWKKGLDRLLTAFAQTHVGRLVLAGPDDEQLTPRLVQMAKDLKVASRVEFLPRMVLDADKEYLFRAASIFVLPSYSENFGNAVLEAMQCGIPVVVTPEVGAAEIVQQAGAGLVVAGDAEPLANAMRQLVEDPALARSMGEIGRRHVLERYTWNRVAQEMSVLYRTLAVG